ncbi:MAG TPA: hypothetical protein VGX03_32550 [Candidatus Binatia bacterium]|jgi:hypothetical protein|nr:hypothetical protein [Candidatus Binatia bacterium]
MPYEIQLDERPAGYALEAASGEEGRPVKIAAREFTSSEDGALFISRLEGWPAGILAKLPPEANAKPSLVDHLVAVIRQDLTTTVYLNELAPVAEARVTRPVRAGEGMTENDIADITDLRYEGIEIPADAAVVIIFSAGWRKGLFYDFVPLQGEVRSYDLWKLLGSQYSFLTRQGVFRLTDADWEFLVDQLWFPFITLPKQIVNNLVSRAQSRSDLDILVPDVAQYVERSLPALLERWGRHLVFNHHIDLIRHAAEEFQEEDFVSATAILYPRIEGLLRDLQMQGFAPEKATQGTLTERLILARAEERHRYSWLLPERFKLYLREAYFAGFEPGKPAKLSRHSVGHGVAAVTDFNQKAASIGFLVIDQLFWFLPNENTPNPRPEADGSATA